MLGDIDVRETAYGNRGRLKSYKGKGLLRARGEKMERSFVHCFDRGGMRRTHHRRLANVVKRYIIHITGFNLGRYCCGPCLLLAHPRVWSVRLWHCFLPESATCTCYIDLSVAE